MLSATRTVQLPVHKAKGLSSFCEVRTSESGSPHRLSSPTFVKSSGISKSLSIFETIYQFLKLHKLKLCPIMNTIAGFFDEIEFHSFAFNFLHLTDYLAESEFLDPDYCLIEMVQHLV